MGIQAPTRSQEMQLILSSLVSYNRPVYLLLTFAVSFVVVYFLSKKNILWAILGAILITSLEAFYFATTFVSNVRY
ncbi:hypothetical protein A2715_02820 [Candidatus Woesebacteria bacterium RIFCSPHIGHO2_01_FULL_39_32]|uniref:Uncharacterized protein n=1 Tax=Candidatus Woesebacteria bacterium RIFCSPLOWO2_01_FULL_39_25 TaxID=1802521 RepID=A0A1F8BKE7_9BACT|nr:MAG: hypothetical protein A2124_02455 [Candidatus Woesebacteria bacterium GWB1_37_5]OGM24087.1 MAG: hypothetical protein A2715_02820 [Candidatus Woesebacteria bacterium RIFCSPHIGHO2_01_FULL_39_32]OGM37934.1 MAG: hypothetical protein A3F01_02940 [Candidatus Woesebacteria bacterium RIFCSPHIGHO2_12_FULL_38_11]OGM64430.1 MAG: hypothetical protein A2893_00995 [Candidatus Woesebacteria bacterium RIFCSPLOWO2_01_FULL_39_25]